MDIDVDPIYLIRESQLNKLLDYVEDDDNHTEEKYKGARSVACDIRLGTRTSLPEHDTILALATRERVRNEILDDLITRFDTMNDEHFLAYMQHLRAGGA